MEFSYLKYWIYKNLFSSRLHFGLLRYNIFSCFRNRWFILPNLTILRNLRGIWQVFWNSTSKLIKVSYGVLDHRLANMQKTHAGTCQISIQCWFVYVFSHSINQKSVFTYWNYKSIVLENNETEVVTLELLWWRVLQVSNEVIDRRRFYRIARFLSD